MLSHTFGTIQCHQCGTEKFLWIKTSQMEVFDPQNGVNVFISVYLRDKIHGGSGCRALSGQISSAKMADWDLLYGRLKAKL